MRLNPPAMPLIQIDPLSKRFWRDVAKISADYVIAKSNGNAGVVIFTDSSIPFAEGKSQIIKKELETCSGIKVLEYDNVPLSDVSARMPQEATVILQP